MEPTDPVPPAERRWVGVDLSGAHFEDVDLSGATVRGAFLADVKVSGAWLRDVDIDAKLERVVINGVDVSTYVEAELDRRHPERTKLRPTDAAGFREAWSVIEAMWPPTIARAEALPEAALHARVDGEWSSVETLRHLVFAIDAWVRRAIVGAPDFHPWGLAHDEMPRELCATCGLDPAAAPSFAEIVEVHAGRVAAVRAVLDRLSDGDLDRPGPPNPRAGYPDDPTEHVARRGLRAVVEEEWEHHRFFTRDLAVLEARDGGDRTAAARGT